VHAASATNAISVNAAEATDQNTLSAEDTATQSQTPQTTKEKATNL
jgi:hypothetical protein